LFPAVLMALLFTRNLRKTLMLDHLPKASHLAIAALMAVLMFPLGQQFALWIQQLYPYTPEVNAQVTAFAETMKSAPYWWMPVLLIAILPAFCEEIAFRGFILSGLRHLGHKWWAIGFSAVAFGMVHFFLQQKISAAAVGLVIGLVAVQTGSLIPCMVFHALYNGLTLSAGEFAESIGEELSAESSWSILLRTDNQGLFQPWVLLVSLVGIVACCWWLHRQPYLRSDEEQLQEAREHQLVGA
jgi:sodium transport system permease protein